MKKIDIGSLPVVDSPKTKKLVGIVTDRDLALHVVAEGRDPGQTRIESVMARNLVTCGLQDDLQLALDAMSQSQLRRIPVVDEQGRLVGIITQADIATRLEQPEATGKVVEQISRSKRTVGFDVAWAGRRSVSRFSRPWNNCSSGGQVQGNGQ